MRIKRVAALLLALPLLQLSAMRAEIACERHDSANHRAAPAHEDAHANHAPQPRTPQQDQSNGAPLQPECCQALTSCSLALGMDAGTVSETLPAGRNAVIAALTDIPQSRVAPPDPPPPKA